MVFIMISKLKSHHQILISMIAGYIVGYSFDFSKFYLKKYRNNSVKYCQFIGPSVFIWKKNKAKFINRYFDHIFSIFEVERNFSRIYSIFWISIFSKSFIPLGRSIYKKNWNKEFRLYCYSCN